MKSGSAQFESATKADVAAGKMTMLEGDTAITEFTEKIAVQYDYTWPLVMLACLGVAALLLGFVLKVVDKKKGLGLEDANIQ